MVLGDYAFWAGAAGLAILLAAFFLEQRRKFRRDTLHFNSMNFIGSALLAAYAYYIGSVVFLVLELVWALSALYFIVKALGKRGQAQ